MQSRPIGMHLGHAAGKEQRGQKRRRDCGPRAEDQPRAIQGEGGGESGDRGATSDSNEGWQAREKVEGAGFPPSRSRSPPHRPRATQAPAVMANSTTAPAAACHPSWRLSGPRDPRQQLRCAKPSRLGLGSPPAGPSKQGPRPRGRDTGHPTSAQQNTCQRTGAVPHWEVPWQSIAR